ncbi:zinc finger protein 821 isoform X2 [Hyla sarda]|uniref:zinc finger protein 821 isoform X2 n=1 Tax=Hyla sarda TaxID=327740 RepID=UPI0024C37A1D|nr:zinc finger protein 821 isoform X2 [Hyla sarda]
MSRRKQTTPNKVHWENMFAGLEQQACEAMMKTEIVKQEVSEMEQNDHSSSDSDEDTTIDELSSPTSEEDNIEKEEGEPCGSRKMRKQEGVSMHTAAVVSAKSYLCPVCGRALSSPGSLGRHLLIHSEDQLSNCAVCGAQFSTHDTFNSEKLPEVVSPERWEQNDHKNPNMDFNAVYPAGILLVCNNCVAYRKMMANQTPGVRKWASRRQNEPVEARMQRLERERTAKKSRRDSETPEERELRRMRDREAKRQQRMQETDEQRARRLQRDREAMRLKRANETPEKRQARLVREREAKRLKRRLEKMDMMLRAQFGQDPSAMAALAAEMNFFQLPVGNNELEQQILGKIALDDQNNGTLH